MFDIGFWELMLIAVMGLIVLGPERLPVAIRTVRSWVSGVRKFGDTVKSELSEELRIHELHANLKKAEQSDMANLSPEVAESVKSLQDAAAMVNEPFKKVDRSALDSLISSSLATQKSQSTPSNTDDTEHKAPVNIDSQSQEQQQEHK
jgi:sec-independent protein translocase protein TatB